MAINNRLQWQLDFKQKLKPVNVAGSSRRLFVPINRQLSHKKIAVGCHNPYANDNWEFAGNLYIKLPFSPSQTPPFNQGLILQEIPLTLGKIKFIEFPNYNIYPYTLQIEFGYWHDEMNVEIWKYLGDE